MEVDRIEALVEKIDQAIRIIDNLKNENMLYAEKIEEYEKKYGSMEKENKKLKAVNEELKLEVEKNDKLHKRLEEKIQLILKYLPEENGPKKIKKETKKNDDIFSENNDSELASKESSGNGFKNRRKPAVSEIEKNNEAFDGKDIFNKSNFQKEAVLTVLKEEKADVSEIRYNEALLSSQDEDVDFYLDDENTEKNELPKGVL